MAPSDEQFATEGPPPPNNSVRGGLLHFGESHPRWDSYFFSIMRKFNINTTFTNMKILNLPFMKWCNTKSMPCHA